MQLSLDVSGEPERLQDAALVAHDASGDQLPYPDHLVAVVGVCDDVDVFPEHVYDREAIRRKGTDPSRRLFPVQAALALESFVTECQAELHMRSKSSPTTNSEDSGP